MEDSVPIESRARSALFGSFAGSMWMCWSNAFIGTAVKFWGPAVSLLAVGVIVWSIRRVRSIRQCAGSSVGTKSSIRLSLLFWVIVAVEFLAAGGAGFLLWRTGRSQLIPIAIALIVGLHFFPLARVLRMLQLNATGLGMVLIAAASLVIPQPDVRNVAACAGIGLFMWAKAFVALHSLAAERAAASVV
jgi:hypothetical protein